MNGWWKFHRKMFSHPVCQLPHSQRWVWITILNSANVTVKEWYDGTDRIEIEAGSFITSQENLASLAGVSRQVIRDALTALKKIGSIRTKIRTKRHTQITVVNWPLYQGAMEDENQDRNRKRTTKEPSENQEGTITKEGKKERRKEITLLANPTGFAAFWSAYPRKEGKQAALKAWGKLQPQNGMVETILAALTTQKTRWTDPQYIPHASTWLNGRRWEDVLAPICNAQPAPIDPKTVWKSPEYYRSAVAQGRVPPKQRIPEWETQATP